MPKILKIKKRNPLAYFLCLERWKVWVQMDNQEIRIFYLWAAFENPKIGDIVWSLKRKMESENKNPEKELEKIKDYQC